MAERVVKVRLEAITSGYKRAMDEAARSTSGLVEKAGGVEKLGGSMSRVGGIMTKSVTAPLVLAGGAATKMSIDFESSFAKITGLVGVAQEDVGELKDGVLALAGETAKAPQELADALFTVTSAGFRGAEAMGVLEMAAKASAAGMGETNTIAQALTGAINAYGPEVLDAAAATDILVGTARAGNFETSQLAGSLGLATPMAVQAKISFADLGGAVALLTRRNNNASASLTQITALARAFVVPTAEAVTVLGNLGMTAEDVRTSMGENGLAATLKDLDQRLGGNREQLGKLLGSSEAAAAAFQILDASAEEIDGTFGAVNDSAGVLDSAFAEMAETAGFKNKQAFADLQVALIQVGDVLIPLIANVAEFAAVLVQAFTSLPGPAQQAVIAFAGLLAVTGPLMSVGGKLLTNWQTLGRGLDRVSTGAYSAAGHLGKFGAAVGALALTAVVFEVSKLAKELTTVNTEVERLNRLADDELADTLERMLTRAFTGHAGNPAEAAADFADEIERIAQESPAAAEKLYEIAAAAGGASGIGQAMERAGVTTETMAEAMERGISAAGRSVEAQERSGEIIGEVTGLTEEHIEAVDDQTAAAEEAADAQKEFEDSIKAVTSAMRSQLDPIWAAQEALMGHADAQDAVKVANLEHLAATTDLDKAIKEHGRKSDEAAAAWLRQLDAKNKVEEADRKVVRSALDVAAATTELTMRVKDGSVSVEAAEAQLRGWVDQGIITADQAYKTAEELRGTASAAESIARIGPIVISVTADTTQFDTQMNRVNRTVVESADGTVRTQVTSNIYRSKGGPAGSGTHGGGPRGTDTIPAWLTPGEFVLSADIVDAIKNGRPTAGLPALASTGGPSTTNNKNVVNHFHHHTDNGNAAATVAWAVA